MSADPASDRMWAEFNTTPGIPDPATGQPAGFLGYTIVGFGGTLVMVPVYDACGCPQCVRRRRMDPDCEGCSDLGTACPDHEAGSET